MGPVNPLQTLELNFTWCIRLFHFLVIITNRLSFVIIYCFEGLKFKSEIKISTLIN